MLPYNYRSRSSLLAVFSRMILWTAKTLFVSPRHQYNVHVPCCSHRQDSNSSHRLLVPLLVLTCTLHMAHLLQLHRCDPVFVQLSQSRPHSLLFVPSMWEHILCAQLLPAGEVLVLPWREPTFLSIQILVQGLALFLNRVLSFFLWSTLVNPNLKGTLVLILLTAIACIINSAFPFYNGTQAWRVNILLILFPQPVRSSMRLFYRKPVIMFRTSLISLWRSPATRTSLSCSTRILLSLTLQLTHSRPTLRARVPGGMILLIVRGLLRRLSLTGSPTVTFCSVHIHNVVAKKRDASTDLLQRLHGYMREYNVDFIGGDFNMSAFSTVGDTFTDEDSQRPAIHFSGDLVHWRSRIVNVLVFLSCQSVLTNGVSIHMAAFSLTMRCLAWDLGSNLLIFRCSFIFAIPICPDPAVSCAVSKDNKEDLSADMTKSRFFVPRQAFLTQCYTLLTQSQ